MQSGCSNGPTKVRNFGRVPFFYCKSDFRKIQPTSTQLNPDLPIYRAACTLFISLLFTLDVGAHLWLTFLCAQKGESPAGAKSRHLREAQRF